MIDISSQRVGICSGISASPLEAYFLKIHLQKKEIVAFKTKRANYEEKQAESLKILWLSKNSVLKCSLAYGALNEI